MRSFNPILAAIAWLICLSTTFAAKEDAVVKVKLPNGAGSGVVISPDGIVLTVAHVVDGNSEVDIVWKNGRTLRGKVFSPSTFEDYPALVKVEASKLEYLNVAREVPQEGEPLWFMGYPGGKWTVRKSRCLSNGLGKTKIYFREASTQVMLTTIEAPVYFGGSGGPIVNSKWQVFGNCAVSGKIPSSKVPSTASASQVHVTPAVVTPDFGGAFTQPSQIHDILSKAGYIKGAEGYPTSPRLVMFGKKGCSDCELFAREASRLEVDVRVVKTSDQDYSEWESSYRKHTGKGLDRFPTFWIEATAESRMEGYRPGLLGKIVLWFNSTGRGLVAALIGERIDTTDRLRIGATDPLPPDSSGSSDNTAQLAVSTEQFDSPPTPGEELDPANITVIILAAMQDVGAVKGTAIKLAIDRAAGPLERAINEKIGDKATIVLIPQRTQPDRFSAVTNAARVSANPAAVLVLVKKQSLGLKSLIAGKVERVLEGKVPDSVPVELIFERVHRDDFNAILAATQTREVEKYNRNVAESESPSVTEEGLAAKLVPILTSKIGDKLAASDNALLSKLGDRLKPETPPPKDGQEGPSPSDQGVMGMLGFLIGERLRSAWVRRKMAKQVSEFTPEEATV